MSENNHATTQSSNSDLLTAKCLAMVSMLIATLLFGSIPYMLNRCYKWTDRTANARSAMIIQCLLYFGGGVLLATTFMHLLPEVQEVVNHLQHCGEIAEVPFAVPEMLMCAGFFFMYLIEEAIYRYIHRSKSNKLKANGAEAAFERGRSIRNSALVKDKNENNQSLNKHEIINNVSNNGGQNDFVNVRVAQETMNKENNLFKIPPIINENNGRTVADTAHHHNDYELSIKNNIQPGKQKHCPDHCSPGHSHLPLNHNGANDDVITSSFRGLFIVLALSLHEVFEGLAIGLEDSTNSVWFLFAAVSAHKLVLAFCVGVELIVARTKTILAIIYTLTFATVSPLGILIGIFISHNGNANEESILSAILQGLACGTLLYVIFFEILSKHHSGLATLAALLTGFILMFGLQLLDGHSSHHDHDHDHGCSSIDINTSTSTAIEQQTNMFTTTTLYLNSSNT
uniref:Uncharacterized protein n=1 Tax=Glossina brevipalpis TaxID=37001 RepID=A0A1A9X4X5_9MUSC